MTALKNAPLIYTLGMIQFPKVPGIERFIDLFLDKIRNEYPLVDEVKVPVFKADFSPQGIQIGQHESKLWQFLSVSQPTSMKTKELLKNLKKLRGISKEVFSSFGTEFLQAAWR